MQKRMDRLDWNDLQTFLAIAEAGSLSAAARTLGVTQPTMGRRLKALEARAGARLLEAIPRGFVLTGLGEATLDHARTMRAAMDAAERTISGRDMRLEGMVRITTVEILASAVVLPAIQAVRAEHPGIGFALVPATRALSLSRREADIALRVAPFEGQSLIVRRVGTLHHGLFASRDWARARPGLAHWQPVGPIVTVLEDQQHLPQVAWFHERFAAAEIAMRTNDRAVMAEAAAAGVGIACLPSIVEGLFDGLAPIDSPDLPQPSPVWLGVHADLQHTPRIRVAMDAIARQCAAATL